MATGASRLLPLLTIHRADWTYQRIIDKRLTLDRKGSAMTDGKATAATPPAPAAGPEIDLIQPGEGTTIEQANAAWRNVIA